MRTSRWLIGLALLLGAVTASAQNEFFPLTQWLHWTYVDNQGGVLRAAVVGKEVVRRKETTVIDWIEEGHSPQHFRNYWTTDLFGWIYLNASWNDDGTAIAYDPPIPWLPPVLEVGYTWDASFDYYLDWDADSPDGTLQTQRAVLREADFDLVAGQFHGYLVTDYNKSVPSPDGVHDLLGRRLDRGKDTGYLYWYAAGTGQIIREWYQLISLPVAAETRTWSDVKMLFR